MRSTVHKKESKRTKKENQIKTREHKKESKRLTEGSKIMRAREEIQQKSDLGKSTRKKRKITYGRERERLEE